MYDATSRGTATDSQRQNVGGRKCFLHDGPVLAPHCHCPAVRVPRLFCWSLSPPTSVYCAELWLYCAVLCCVLTSNITLNSSLLISMACLPTLTYRKPSSSLQCDLSRSCHGTVPPVISYCDLEPHMYEFFVDNNNNNNNETNKQTSELCILQQT